MSNCSLCGEPMQPGEEMFKFHGSLGPCPAPPLKKPKLANIVEYFHRDEDGKFWLDVVVDRIPYQSLVFGSSTARQAAHDDVLEMVRSVGGVDLPNRTQ